MIRWRSLWQLFLARMREYYREPTVLFWTYGFPLFLALGLAVAFSGGPPDDPQEAAPGRAEVAIEQGTDGTDTYELVRHLQAAGIEAHTASASDCRRRMRAGEVALIVVPGTRAYRYIYDPARPGSRLARWRVDAVIQRWKAGHAEWPTQDETPTLAGDRYIDFLIPGLMGLNLMGGGLWGVGYAIVDMRGRRLLKRLLATPMRAGDFLLAVLGSRVFCLLVEMLFLLLAGLFLFGVPMRGNPGALALVVLVGGTTFAGLGLVLTGRAENTETVAGLINLLVLPMWMLSGTFFSPDRFPAFFRPVIRALPLTHLNDALRAVMLEGASVAQIYVPLAILAGWAVAAFLLARGWFSWR